MSEMTTAIGNAERALVMGDLSKLTPDERQAYYLKVCESVGLNPLTQPFAYLTLNGKLILYAKRDATDQLRKLHGVSITSLAAAERDGVYIVTATAKDAEGRTDVANGAVTIGGLEGDMLANAIMKAESKAKRRVTLSLCGLGFLDETEIETIPEAHVTQPPTNRLPPPKADLKSRCLDYESRLVAKGACKPGELMAYVASMADQDGFDVADWSKWQDEAADAYGNAVKGWGEARLASMGAAAANGR